MVVGVGSIVIFFVTQGKFEGPNFYDNYKKTLRYEIMDTQGNPREFFHEEDPWLAKMFLEKDREYYEGWKEWSDSKRKFLYAGGSILLLGFGFFISAKK